MAGKLNLAYDLDDGGQPSQFTQDTHTLIDQDHAFGGDDRVGLVHPQLFRRDQHSHLRLQRQRELVPSAQSVRGPRLGAGRRLPGCHRCLPDEGDQIDHGGGSAMGLRSPPPTTPAVRGRLVSSTWDSTSPTRTSMLSSPAAIRQRFSACSRPEPNSSSPACRTRTT